MGHRHPRGRTPSARTTRRAKLARRIKPQARAALPRLRCADRRSLLAGTALASSLLLGSLLAPTPARAVDCFAASVPPAGASGPIIVPLVADAIICTNVDDRFNNNGDVIDLRTTGAGANHFIDLFNSGTLFAYDTGDVTGVFTVTNGVTSPISIVNSGDIRVTSGDDVEGIIFARTTGAGSPVSIVNSGNLTAIADSDATGIEARANAAGSDITIINSGNIGLIAGNSALGIFAETYSAGRAIAIENSGDITATAFSGAIAILARTFVAGLCERQRQGR